jgi:hypothetical protein
MIGRVSAALALLSGIVALLAIESPAGALSLSLQVSAPNAAAG